MNGRTFEKCRVCHIPLNTFDDRLCVNCMTAVKTIVVVGVSEDPPVTVEEATEAAP